MFLRSLWERVRVKRKPRESAVLDPVEQLVIRFLLSHCPSTRENVYTEVNSTRPASASDVDKALARPEGLELVASRLRVEGDQSEAFSPSIKGTRLKGHIPLEPKTVTEFYL